MEKDSQKLGELLKQLEESGYDVKESVNDSNLEMLKENSSISKETLNKLSNNSKADFGAWVAWQKSF
ncbi:hypothetical protein [Sphingobacterium multivorum]|uniref:hypothetical protein n=1 Tax=Sphingobacterium multivorum TaxID=28454 RepID=UPI0030172891